MHVTSLALVWLTFALIGIVFIEPAPVDAMLIGLVVLLPAVGLAQFDRVTGFYAVAWLLICAGGFISNMWAEDVATANKHIAVTLYLAIASVVIAAFVRTNPQRHVAIIEAGILFAGGLAAITALIGIFQLVPGANIFVVYDRATGTFKDPNVMGAFMVVPILIALRHVTEARLMTRALYALLTVLMTLALILSLSRGAYFNLMVSVVAFFYLRFISARALLDRLQLVLMVVAGIAMTVLIGVAALNFDRVGALMASRLGAQAYDLGEQGRFAGQEIALTVIAENPLGIGAVQFSPQYHREAPHQVYLSMFLNSGWVGGFAFILVCLATLFFAFRHALRATPVQSSLLAFTGCWVGLVAEGFIIDSDHWRHLFIVLAMIWGILASALYQTPLQDTGAPAPSTPRRIKRWRPSLQAMLEPAQHTGSRVLQSGTTVPAKAAHEPFAPRVRGSLKSTRRSAA